MMKRAQVALPILLISVLLVSMWVPMLNPTTTSNKIIADQTPDVSLAYVPHATINIYDDDDFNATAVAESWEGNGTADNPYIIEGYEITEDEVLIYITDTRAHFEIRDCNLTDAWAAIQLNNVSNGLIENCLINIPDYGIYMYNVSAIDVIGCDITVHPTYPETGISIEQARDINIESCVIEGATGSGAGIGAVMHERITLFNNTIFNFDQHGIFSAAFDEMEILNNTLYWNEGILEACGMYLVEGMLADIVGNNITENTNNGITIDGVFNVTIIENTIVDNWIHGIAVSWADFVVIQDNWIEGHGDGQIEGPLCGISLFESDYCEIIDNTFWYNALNSITLVAADFTYVFGNYINHSFDHGIYIAISLNVTIEENEIYNSYAIGGTPSCGIVVESSDGASLLNNILGENVEDGIGIAGSDYGEVIGNTIYESEMSGIRITSGEFWTIYNNLIYDNGAPGIYLNQGAFNNTLWHNDVGWSGETLVYDAGLDNDWNYTGIGNWYSDYNGTGVYPIPSQSSTDYYPEMSLYLGDTTPGSYEAGTTGNTMDWDASALNPGDYEVLIDGELHATVEWDGENIEVDVDGLPVGVYNVTLVVYHVSGHWLSNSSTLTVVDTIYPEWDAIPEDQVINEGESFSYQLGATDASGIGGWSVNDTSNFAISAEGLITNAAVLEVGSYGLNISVWDTQGHVLSHTIRVRVNALPVTTTTTTTSTTTTSTTTTSTTPTTPTTPTTGTTTSTTTTNVTSPPPGDFTTMIIVIAGAGGVVIIIVIVIIMKKH
ncbi:MAG: NosD domain-containing protein [Candidatus Thorarchaeota archaeon]